ncbi:hypothetical protein [Fictibacillus sp. NRS-1165]|uniref:hypothetical protein n=1 Tax=Fictibacillus sp. NRS-1165 TaxID=3144463 RepID=UPI003D252A27
MNRHAQRLGNVLSWLLASLSVLLVFAAGFVFGGWPGLLMITVLWLFLYRSVS